MSTAKYLELPEDLQARGFAPLFTRFRPHFTTFTPLVRSCGFLSFPPLAWGGVSVAAASSPPAPSLLPSAPKFPPPPPPPPQDRIFAYYEFVQTASHPGPSGMSELSKLPKKLYEAIALHLHGPAIDAVPLLRGLEQSFLAELSLRVTAHVFLPGEVVFREGDISREMYFVVYGTCEAEAEDGSAGAKIDGAVVGAISAGSYFGELALIAVRFIAFSSVSPHPFHHPRGLGSVDGFAVAG